MIWPACNVYKGGDIPSWAKFMARGKHRGIDICHRYGKPVVAAEDGTVSWVGDMKAGGWQVRIKHSGGLETRYGHLKPGSILVKRGQQVSAGDQIAQIGHSGLERVPSYVGKLKQVAHLHFEVLKNNQLVDPEAYLAGSGALLVGILAGAGLVLLSIYG
jgi:murein DD-endopeptidase MepM/ murein hydrolase activator NlpD